MAIEKVKEFFRKQNMESRVRELAESSATVELAAAALHCEPERIAKTLSFLVEGKAVLIVAAGDAKIDNQKYKAQFGTKARMLTPEQVESMVGHTVGGVCPFAVNEEVSTYLDISLRRFHTVFPACGSSNSAIELTIGELEKYARPIAWINVCKGWSTI
jgi:prolyl-tRNA editing enzyme YbaK/EbsC (Cys-tRNA(Pro) deacylase)